jgi:predicted transcriptional regulator
MSRKLPKVTITVRSMDDLKAEWCEALRGNIQSIEREGTLTLVSMDTVAKVFSQRKLEILSIVVTEQPKSIHALVKLVERDFKSVYADVKFLAELELLELRFLGRKRELVVPVAKYSAIALDFAA